jgi:hypothetical protein
MAYLVGSVLGIGLLIPIGPLVGLSMHPFNLSNTPFISHAGVESSPPAGRGRMGDPPAHIGVLAKGVCIAPAFLAPKCGRGVRSRSIAADERESGVLGGPLGEACRGR